MSEGTSPASSGPAGSLFEAQVGGYYLLTVLVGAEPRGLPGTVLDKVEFQRAGEGRFLDDVILHAHDSQGKSAILEVQVKRGVTFSPRDPIFRSIVEQIAKTALRSDFFNARYELGIAISRSSQKIDGRYQDLLTWAREIGDAATFMNRINRRGAGNEDMRTFVETFRSHLREFGAPDDDQMVWRVLQRLQILVFDFTAQGSACEQLAKERAVRALHMEDGNRAGDLWNALTGISLRIAAAGGDRDRERLIEDLRQQSFPLAGERRYSTARAALAEASRHALADISDRVGGVTLSRHERISAIRAALDTGRYVEIRGNAGVGKSALLKHFAEQMAAEAQVIVLSPSRTIPRGWLAMKATLGFDDTARECLTDLAADGSAAMFLDSLDFYGEEERRTVIDLVREAAKVPGFYVIATARPDFGVLEPSWLPADALDELGRAEPVVIDDLTGAETDELRDASPEIASLLAENHPARAVARNLFRLARLVRRPASESMPHTEAEMAQQWWQTADGQRDEGYRDRARVLRSLAEQTVARAEQLDVSGHPAAAIDALVASETLRDLGNDRVAFRHDVLRDWAVANLLLFNPAVSATLPLDRPAPASLVRGVEVASRMAIELSTDATDWHLLLLRLSGEGVNGSWRRSVLLGLVRSERAGDVLKKVSAHLLEDRAPLLRELIRTVMATEVEPATKRFAAVGLTSKLIPAGLNLPNGPAWLPLIGWVLSLGAQLPASVIPEVVDLYSAWSMGFLGHDALTPILLRYLYDWLTEIDSARDVERFRDRRRLFNGELSSEQIGALEGDLRMGFLAFCNRTPELAARYLESLRKKRHRDPVVQGVLKFRGALAQAAPRELAELTAELLIGAEKDAEEAGSPFREPFGYANLDFVPVSPSQGPFMELLLHAPEHGLRLIRQLVDHAVSFRSRGREFGTNAFRIPTANGEDMVFPWTQSYGWSRDIGSGPAIVTSALMALEAWAHSRIEAGDAVEDVLADVIGPAHAPAAYLLVVVDLLLSHSPKSLLAAVPFVACPELLCLDRERSIADTTEIPDILGVRELQREPIGLASTESLKARPSRRSTLENLLGSYALDQSDEDRRHVTELLLNAAARLGPPKAESTLGDAKFMVVHALNLVDPKNWQEVSLRTEHGLTTGWEYVSPASEAAHLKPLQDESRERQANGVMRARIGNTLNDPKRSSPEFAAEALNWAQRMDQQPNRITTEEDEDADKAWMREEAIVTAALIGVRDGGAELITNHLEWIRSTFLRALNGKDDPVHRFRAGLKYNPMAIAFAGMVLLLKSRFSLEDARIILDASGNHNPAAAHGFAATAALIASIDERLPRSVLRCALAASVHAHREWNRPEEEYKTTAAQCRKQIEIVIEGEMAWLAGELEEPEWPILPTEATRSRRRHRLMDEQPEAPEETSRPSLYTDHQAAALWLEGAASLFDVTTRPWLRDIVRSYARWTYAANGSELDEHDDVDRPPREWNAVYFKVLAACLPGLTREEIDEIALAYIVALPDESFFDVTTDFLRDVDSVFLSGKGLLEPEAVHIRSALAQRLMKSHGWIRHGRERSKNIETHLGPVTAVLFFNEYGHLQAPNCYLSPKGIDQVDPFFTVLQELAERGTFLFVAIVFANLLEVSPRAAQLPLITAAANAWMLNYSEDKTFWVESDIGRRLCVVLETIFNAAPQAFNSDTARRHDIDRLLAALVRLGIPDAYRLEEALPGR